MQFLTNITNNGRKNLCGRKKKLHKILDATRSLAHLDVFSIIFYNLLNNENNASSFILLAIGF
jgi:hypothetical protein